MSIPKPPILSSGFILNPAAGPLDLEDALSERLSQARGIVVALNYGDTVQELKPAHTADVLWAVDRLLEEAERLHWRLDELRRGGMPGANPGDG